MKKYKIQRHKALNEYRILMLRYDGQWVSDFWDYPNDKIMKTLEEAEQEMERVERDMINHEMRYDQTQWEDV